MARARRRSSGTSMRQCPGPRRRVGTTISSSPGDDRPGVRTGGPRERSAPGARSGRALPALPPAGRPRRAAHPPASRPCCAGATPSAGGCRPPRSCRSQRSAAHRDSGRLGTVHGLRLAPRLARLRAPAATRRDVRDRPGDREMPPSSRPS